MTTVRAGAGSPNGVRDRRRVHRAGAKVSRLGSESAPREAVHHRAAAADPSRDVVFLARRLTAPQRRFPAPFVRPYRIGSDGPRFLASPSTSARKSSGGHGLTTNALHPAFLASATAWSSALHATMGMCLVSSVSFRHRIASM